MLGIVTIRRETTMKLQPKHEEGAFRILLVEDDADLATVLAETLRFQGNEVFTADTALSAIRMAIEHRPDAILLDLNLPDGHGYDVAKTLRRECLSDAAAVVVLTGATDLRGSDEAGVDLVLTKPVKEDLLSGMLRSIRAQRIRRKDQAPADKPYPGGIARARTPSR